MTRGHKMFTRGMNEVTSIYDINMIVMNVKATEEPIMAAMQIKPIQAILVS